MRYDLASMWRRARNPRRRVVVLRKIVVPAMMATNLYRAVYRPIIAKWRAALPSIMAEYERTLAEIVQDSPADAAEEISRVERDLEAIMLTVRLRLEEWSLTVERYHRRKWRGAILTATGVDISTLVGAGDMRLPIGAAIERNVNLVRSVSDETRRRIADTVFRSFQQRRDPRDVGRELAKAIDMSERRAKNIAADQNVKLASALNEERRREAGIDTFQWVHSGKLHPRPEHIARDGKRYTDDKPPPDMPGELPYCGCTSRAVLELS